MRGFVCLLIPSTVQKVKWRQIIDKAVKKNVYFYLIYEERNLVQVCLFSNAERNSQISRLSMFCLSYIWVPTWNGNVISLSLLNKIWRVAYLILFGVFDNVSAGAFTLMISHRHIAINLALYCEQRSLQTYFYIHRLLSFYSLALSCWKLSLEDDKKVGMGEKNGACRWETARIVMRYRALFSCFCCSLCSVSDTSAALGGVGF